MIIYPAIDLKDGQCVRLVQGKKENKTVYSDTPGKLAASFQSQGAEFLHVVDLDGAFEGSPRNLAAIKEIAASISIPFQVGGGLRSREDVERLLEIGASRVIIGTRAVTSPAFITELLADFGPTKVILGLDAREGMVAIEGWVEKSSLRALEFGEQMRKMGVETAIYTDVSMDGLLQGPNLASIEEMAGSSGLKIIASGGVSSVDNIKALKKMESLGVSGAIIGKALYDGKISIEEALNAAK
ncbi:MAG: 1-(5-phosphoribosyl)-5-[(5-phosphoribosylamino)methylideneamino]imidazole-4-carboxamide isomerase [Firmicutes bacterium HGW-Firmicutes-15]|nr:MAG: 1-(5-phosphoribosyl)-5-[(5-phosphoribosylamino)methylideneamino]imidazole-4-carboxamide isomerase [Firmicutes bacterium HGW-Firmicutes-15]